MTKLLHHGVDIYPLCADDEQIGRSLGERLKNRGGNEALNNNKLSEDIGER